eukprot:6810408-Pyramimonas_sp.AAC.2
MTDRPQSGRLVSRGNNDSALRKERPSSAFRRSLSRVGVLRGAHTSSPPSVRFRVCIDARCEYLCARNFATHRSVDASFKVDWTGHRQGV